MDEVTLREMISENKDVTKVVTSKITNFECLFSNNTVFNQNIGNWDVSKVTSMTSMFSNARAFNQNLSGWDVDQVIHYANFGTGTTAWSAANKPQFGSN